MQFTKKSESMSYLTSNEMPPDGTSQSSLKMKFQSNWRKFFAIVFLLSLILLAGIIWFIVMHPSKETGKVVTVPVTVPFTGAAEDPIAQKLVEENDISLVVHRNIESVSPNPTTNISSALARQDVEKAGHHVQHQIDLSDVKDHINKVQGKTSKNIQELETELHRYVSYANNAMDAVHNLTAKLNHLEMRVDKLVNLTKRLNSSVELTQIELYDASNILSSHVKKLENDTNASLNRLQQNVSLELEHNSRNVSSLLVSMQSNVGYQYEELNKTVHSHRESLNQQFIEITANQNISQERSQRETANQIGRLERRINESVANITFYMNNHQEMNETYIERIIESKTSVLRNRIHSVESQLQQSSEQQISAAVNSIKANVDNKIAIFGNNLNQSMRVWIANRLQERKTKIERLESLVNEKLQQGAAMQNKVNSLSNQAKSNTANLDKLYLQLNEVNHKLADKADSGWIQTPGGYSYYVAKERTNWVTAKNTCENMQSHLAYAGLRKSHEMYQYIVAQVVKPLGKTLWIGLNDLHRENSWSWNDGSALVRSDSHWKVGQPNNYQNQDCAEMDTTGLWGDLSCSGHVTAYALCEKADSD